MPAKPSKDAQPAARPRRADAQRNVEAILSAARESLAANPDATLAEIAQAAGVGRITLYGHFRTRAELIEAVLTQVMEESGAVIDATDTRGDPAQALARLVAASWRIVDQYRSLRHAAENELPSDEVRALHDRHLQQVTTLITRGQRAGTFRRDLPRTWLVSLCFSTMHAAAEDVGAGRMAAEDAPRLITAALLGALTPPGRPVPDPEQ